MGGIARRVVAVAITLALLAVVGCGSSGGSSGKQAEARTPAEKLATLQEHHPVTSSSDPLVETFDQHLKSLDGKCRESEEQIAALVFGTQQTMAKAGVNESLSDLIGQLDTTVPSSGGHQDCHGEFAAYATSRTKK